MALLPSVAVLETLAQLLHDQFRRRGVMAAEKFLRDYVLSDDVSKMDKRKMLPLFMVVCEKMNLHTSFLVSYIYMYALRGWFCRIENEELSMAFRVLYKSARIFYIYALETEKWNLALLMLESTPSTHRLPLVRATVEQYKREEEEEEEDPDVFRYLMIVLKGSPSRTEILTDFITGSIKTGMSQLFQPMVNSRMVSLSEIEGTQTDNLNENGYIRTSVLSMLLESFACLERKHRGDLKDMVVYVIANGLSTYQASFTTKHTYWNVQSPLQLAAIFGCPHLVRLLYRSGATTNSELFQANKALEATLRGSVDNEGQRTLRRIYWYVNSASRHPRRLRDLCLLAVSHAVGCRSYRARRVATAALPVLKWQDKSRRGLTPYTLEERVLLNDVLLDFRLKSSRIAADRDPQGV